MQLISCKWWSSNLNSVKHRPKNSRQIEDYSNVDQSKLSKIYYQLKACSAHKISSLYVIWWMHICFCKSHKIRIIIIRWRFRTWRCSTQVRRAARSIHSHDECLALCLTPISFIMSTLEIVVGRESTANWSSHKVPSFTPLAQFHTKFRKRGGLRGGRFYRRWSWDRSTWFGFALITSESSNMPRSQSLHVLLSQVSQELVSLADITLVLLSISDTRCECAVRKKQNKKKPRYLVFAWDLLVVCRRRSF